MWNNAINVAKNLRNLSNPFLSVSSDFLSQQTRNTFILKRRWPLGLTKKNTSKKPFLKSRHYVYDLIEDTNIRRKPDLEVILTTYVDGLGNKGDKVSMRPNIAYNKLLLPGLAVYATPENRERYENVKDPTEIVYSSPYVERTMNLLSRRTLAIHLSDRNPWTLEKWHVKTAFRKAGFHMQDETITLPEHPIVGPDASIEGKEFYVTVTINNKEQVNVRCRIYHLENPQSKLDIDFYKKPAEPLFSEHEPILNSIPTYYEKPKSI